MHTPGRSDFEALTEGMPQDSVIGQIFFFPYMNSLPHFTKHFSVFMYADHSALLYAHESTADLISTANRELETLCNWFTSNRLVVNVTRQNTLYLRASGNFFLPKTKDDSSCRDQAVERPSRRNKAKQHFSCVIEKIL